MIQQNLDKFISRKNKTIYIAGVPNTGQESFSSNLSRRMDNCPIINIDCLLEAKLIDIPNMTIDKLLDLIKETWIKESSKHKSFIMEGCSIVLYNTLGVRDSLILLNKDVIDWSRNLSRHRCHILSDYLSQFNPFEETMPKFEQGKNLKPIDSVSQLFLSRLC